jgi:4-alpha-glucanotransferase
MATPVGTRSKLLRPLPFEKGRDAGILLHITSLPSQFGIGDLGPEARNFVNFLSGSKQRYWQILPLNPVSSEQYFSPYSSTSSMAGNPLLISPEVLEANGLIKNSDLSAHHVPATERVDFERAAEVRDHLLKKAATKFFKNAKLTAAFNNFCRRESYWLADFALYQALKKHHDNSPWFEWKEEYKMRSSEALNIFSKKSTELRTYIMWQQYIFSEQWTRLKTFANNSGVLLFGDLPFYVSHDSSDVWANRDIFNVDKAGLMKGVAGVPPDYFNSNGQLWGMPTFKWDILQKQNYDWWIKRLRKNMQQFDVLRLDHFRAFANYWEVPAGKPTARRGKWKIGPGHLFFKTVQSAIGDVKFVAEDLGDIDENVFKLRDDFGMPGMKILQFAFGDEMAGSAYSPHNYTTNFIAYTGTHDNNTTVGWFRKDIKRKEKKQISSYTGKVVDEKSIHIELSRLAYASVARTVILPLQDVLGANEKARMNTPATTTDNWKWRFKKNALTLTLQKRLANWVSLYNRF